MLKRLRYSGTLLAVFLGILQASSSHAQTLDLPTIARRAAEGVGKVGDINSTGTKGPVFVFEEFHTSRVGQLQGAVMLLRLHDHYGLKTIGLEGGIQAPRPLDAGWFHAIGGAARGSIREDVAVRMLGEGEISQGEFMTLVLPDIRARGLERRDEYDVTLDVQGNPQLRYLLAIAEKGSTRQDIAKVNELASAKKTQEALDYLLTRDQWVRKQYEALKDSGATPVEQGAANAREIQRKASEVGATVEPADSQDMGKVIRFFDAASRRSNTMADYVGSLPDVASGIPVGMIIGAAHTRRVLQGLRSNGIRFVQITPLALNPKYGSLTTEQFDRRNAGKWAQITPGALGRLLNAQRKPPPFIGTATAKSYASMALTSILVARAARAGGSIPDSVWPDISALPELRIDRASFQRDGYDVIFRGWVKDTAGKDKEVWARVGTLGSAEEARTLEQKLLQAIADLGGEGRLPPRQPPGNSTATKDEGPGDGKRGDKVINRYGRELAVFADSKAGVNQVGKISG